MDVGLQPIRLPLGASMGPWQEIPNVDPQGCDYGCGSEPDLGLPGRATYPALGLQVLTAIYWRAGSLLVSSGQII